MILQRISSLPKSGMLLPWRHLMARPYQQRPFTVRANIARMLLSTKNQSHIVDISHDEELRRGLKTSGEKYNEEDDKTVVEQLTDKTEQMKEKVKQSLKPADDNESNASITEATERAKAVASDETKKAMGQFGDEPELSTRAGEHSQTMREGIKESMDKVGNSTSRTGTTEADLINDESLLREKAAERLEGASYNAADTLQGKSDRARGQLDTSQIHTEDWDVASKVMRENREGTRQSQGGQDVDVDYQHIQPGTRNLRGTDDNFDDDPSISLDDMQDKVRDAKEKITEGKDHLMDSIGQSMKHTSENVKDAVKGVTKPIRETLKRAASKAKEFATGEREDEKPDMRKSPVRTKEGDFPPGTRPEDVVKKNNQDPML